MVETGLDQFDQLSVSPERYSSNLPGANRTQNAQGAQETNVFTGTFSDVRQEHSSDGTHAPLVDEPECYEDEDEGPLPPCWSPAGPFAFSPKSATFSAGSCSIPDAYPSTPRPDSFSRRKALLIGIKYYRRRYLPKGLSSLKGPHHDLREVQKLLEDEYGWNSDCFRILKDDNGPRENQPTLENIRREIKDLVEGARPGDNLFFYFSGHGSQIYDRDGDEDDGLDEVVVTCDGKFLVDDELHATLVNPLPPGCNLTAVLDCCSSGTSLDLPYNAAQSRDPVGRSRMPTRKHSKGNAILLSACADSERAYEKQDQEDDYKRVRGMLTKAFIDTLKTRRRNTYQELMTSIQSHLRRRYSEQNPKLSSSNVLDMNGYFHL